MPQGNSNAATDSIPLLTSAITVLFLLSNLPVKLEGEI
jgi:hypothetical protein